MVLRLISVIIIVQMIKGNVQSETIGSEGNDASPISGEEKDTPLADDEPLMGDETTTASVKRKRLDDSNYDKAEEESPKDKVFRAESGQAENTYKRISVPPVVTIHDNAPLDLFRLNSEDLRKRQAFGVSDVWKWDYWCQLQAKAGNCTDRKIRYYYDSRLDQCQKFTFSGCNGNPNSFNNEEDCQRHCKGAAFVTLKESRQTDPCDLQPSAGLCLAIMPRVYYDVNENTCKSFIYGGCGGNRNRFSNVRACEVTCVKRYGKKMMKDGSE